MKTTPIHNSSAITSVGYDAATGECLVTFRRGGTSTHTLTAKQHADFLAAASIGSYYHQYIKAQPHIPQTFKMTK